MRGWPPGARSTRVGPALVVLAAFVSATWLTARSPLVGIARIEVIGGFQVTTAQALEATGVRMGEPLLGIDHRTVQARLEALPWVRSARVARVFPRGLQIHLKERLAVATVAQPDGGFALLDETGRVLFSLGERPVGLPEVTGAGPTPAPGLWLDRARPALAAVAGFPEALSRQISAAAVDDDRVSLRMGEVEVRLGPPEQLQMKAAALSAIFARLGGRPVAYIDVALPGSPVVAPAGPVAGATTASTAERPRPASALATPRSIQKLSLRSEARTRAELP